MDKKFDDLSSQEQNELIDSIIGEHADNLDLSAINQNSPISILRMHIPDDELAVAERAGIPLERYCAARSMRALQELGKRQREVQGEQSSPAQEPSSAAMTSMLLRKMLQSSGASRAIHDAPLFVLREMQTIAAADVAECRGRIAAEMQNLTQVQETLNKVQGEIIRRLEEAAK